VTVEEPEVIARELEEARKVQMGMLPQSTPEIPGFEIAAHIAPALSVGGDFYDFIALPGAQMGVVFGDAVGHGIASALLMSMTLANFRFVAPMETEPDVVIEHINHHLCLSKGVSQSSSVTAAYGILDWDAGVFTCCAAGLQPFRTSNGVCTPVAIGGTRFPLGITEETAYEQVCVDLGIGEMVIFITDGIPESVDSGSEMYGYDRLTAVLTGCASMGARETIETVLRDVKKFVGDEPQQDDISVVIVKRTSEAIDEGLTITGTPDSVIQSMLRETDSYDLAIAMLGFTETEQTKILNNMSGRAGGLLKEEIETVRDRQPQSVVDRHIDLVKEKLRKHAERSRVQRPILANELMIKTLFQYQLSPRIIDQLLRNPALFQSEATEREATVLFSDIRNATELHSIMQPRDMYHYLNEYFEIMTQIIIDNDGLLDKFVGDEIMAMWGVPVHFEDHAYKACKAALEMQEVLEVLRVKWQNEGKPVFRIGIGINSGPMIVGSLGSKQKMNYTPFGENVNLGARLEGTNKAYGTEILISEFTYELAKERITARGVDTIPMRPMASKGGQETVTIHELLGCLSSDDHAE
jgi:class 3 adenylate cyclase